MQDSAIVFPGGEAVLSPGVRGKWLEVIEGEAGVAAGNSLYLGGVFSIPNCLFSERSGG